MSLEIMWEYDSKIEIQKWDTVVLDFDDTLFSRGEFGKDFFLVVAKLALSAKVRRKRRAAIWNRLKNLFTHKRQLKETLDQVNQYYQQLKSEPITWFDNLCRMMGLDKEEVLSEVKKLIQNHSTGFMFDDAINFVKSLIDRSNKIVILTAGPWDFQQAKIEAAFAKAKLPIDNIEIIVVKDTNNKLSPLKTIKSQNPGVVWYFDDRLPQGCKEVDWVTSVLVARDGVKTQGEGEAVIRDFRKVIFPSDVGQALSQALSWKS